MNSSPDVIHVFMQFLTEFDIQMTHDLQDIQRPVTSTKFNVTYTHKPYETNIFLGVDKLWF